MIAPEPFFEPRGTPFSEYHRIRALLDLGHTVDLVTYPFGRDVSMPGLRLFRCLRPPFIHEVRIGPSLAKIPLDLALTLTAFRRAFSERYDVVHSHEEGSFIGVVLAAMLRVPHLYDMHSSLPQQLTNFAFSRSKLLHAAFRWMERLVIRRSRAVIVICQHLEDTVREIEPSVPTVLIENAPGSGDEPVAGSGAAVRAELRIPSDAPMVLYTGTFEAYQGLDLLFASARLVLDRRPDTRFVLAGGRPDQVAAAKADAARAGLGEAVILAGQRPAEEIPAFLDAADLLVSPRSSGTNTPLKIYQYLRAGRAIVDTAIRSHTQVLDSEVAELVTPTAAGIAEGLLRVLSNPGHARLLAARAAQLAHDRYGEEAYLRSLEGLLDRLPLASRSATLPGGATLATSS